MQQHSHEQEYDKEHKSIIRVVQMYNSIGKIHEDLQVQFQIWISSLPENHRQLAMERIGEDVYDDEGERILSDDTPSSNGEGPTEKTTCAQRTEIDAEV